MHAAMSRVGVVELAISEARLQGTKSINKTVHKRHGVDLTCMNPTISPSPGKVAFSFHTFWKFCDR